MPEIRQLLEVVLPVERWTAADVFPVPSRKNELRVGASSRPYGARLTFTGAALLFDALETALSLPAGSLAADTIEGSGLQLSFAAVAGSRLQFDWRLSTVDFDPAQADRAFVLIDGNVLTPLGTAAASTVSGHFSHTFSSAGTHALAIVVMDVAAADRVSTLALSHLSVSAVPEPGSWALMLAGLGVVGVAGRRRLTSAAARRR